MISSELKHTQGEVRLLVSRSALMHNARLLRRTVPAGVKICAVLKADACGHGAAVVADTLCNFSSDEHDLPAIDQVAVTSIEEAARLPELPVPILVLRAVENAFLGSQRSAIELAVTSGFTLTIDTPAAASDVARIAMSCGRRAAVNVMLDTGLSRGGCAPEDLEALLRRIESQGSLRLVSLGTQLASGEQITDPFTLEQLRRFRVATDDYAAAGGGRVRRHAANSAATFLCAASHFDLVRPGLAIYGIDPLGRPSLDRPLRPVLKWTAPLIGIRELPAGTRLGGAGDRPWIAARPTRVGLVPVGYADGYDPRSAGRGAMLLDGTACPVIGPVEMDLTMIDLTAVEHPTLGHELTLLDPDPLSPCSLYALARWAELTPAQVLTRLRTSLRRIAIEPADDIIESSVG